MANALQQLTQDWWQRSDLKRIFKGEGPQSQPFELNRRRIFILPTRHGLLFAGVLLIMLLGAINYNNSLAYMLTFLLTSMAIVSILHTYKNMSGLVFRAGKASPVFAGQSAIFEVFIDNRNPDTRFAIQLKSLNNIPVITDVTPQQTTTVYVAVPVKQRGILKSGRFTIFTRYPLGLFRAWSYVDLDMSCLVYPQPAHEKQLPLMSPRKLSSEGDQGRGADDFVGFRSYNPGDSLRHVHWKAVARDQVMLTKQFGGDRVEELWLDWDRLDYMDNETRLRQLCRWVLEAEARYIHYGLRLPGQTIEPDQGASHYHQCLQALALFGTGDEN